MPLRNGIANPTCNGYFNYSLFQHVNTFIPTEQVNLKSSSLKWLDFNGQYQYSHAHMETPYDAFFNGLESRTLLRGFNTTGSSSNARWNSSSADVSATIHISDKLAPGREPSASATSVWPAISSTWRPVFFKPPEEVRRIAADSDCDLSAHDRCRITPSSPADIINEITSNLIAQNTKQNDFQVQYDMSRQFGVRAGFVWQNHEHPAGRHVTRPRWATSTSPITPNRGNCAGLPLNPDGSCTFTGVIAPFGGSNDGDQPLLRRVSARGFAREPRCMPTWMRNTGAPTTGFIASIPSSFLNVKGNVRYAPRPWLMLGGNLMFQRARNNNSDLAYNQHNYSAMLQRHHHAEPLAGDSIWPTTIDAIQQNMNICFTGTVVPAGSITVPGRSDAAWSSITSTRRTHSTAISPSRRRRSSGVTLRAGIQHRR